MLITVVLTFYNIAVSYLCLQPTTSEALDIRALNLEVAALSGGSPRKLLAFKSCLRLQMFALGSVRSAADRCEGGGRISARTAN